MSHESLRTALIVGHIKGGPPKKSRIYTVSIEIDGVPRGAQGVRACSKKDAETKVRDEWSRHARRKQRLTGVRVQ